MFVLLLLCFSNITHLAVESVYYQEWVTTLMMFDTLLLRSVWSNLASLLSSLSLRNNIVCIHCDND